MGSIRAGLFACVLVVAAGCAGPAGPRDASLWLEARGADLMDTVGLRLGFGVGLGAWVRVTEYAQLGFMARGPSEGELVGASESARSDSFRVRAVPALMVGTIGRYGGLWSESSREVMLPGYSNRDDARSPIYRDPIAGIVPRNGREDDWRASIGAGAQLVLVGVELELRPWQILDFLAGLLGYDPSGDDVPVAEPPSAGPRSVS